MLPQAKYIAKCFAYLSTTNLKGKNCLIIGATSGIGRSIALKLSSLGANVTVAGRSKEAGSALIMAMRNRGIDEAQMHSFERVDLTSQSDTKRFLESTSGKIEKVGGLDYLFLTAGKPPIAKPYLTSDGIEAHFALQCLGRHSATAKFSTIMRKGGAITAICSPGGGSSVPLDDLEYLKPANKAQYGIIKAGGRDSLFVDSVMLQLAQEYQASEFKFLHLFPGAIHTNAAQTAGFPFPIPLLARTFGPYLLTSPDDYAATPIYEALTAADSAYGNYYTRNQYGNSVKLSEWVLDTENRKAVIAYSERRIKEALGHSTELKSEGVDGSQVGELGIGS